MSVSGSVAADVSKDHVLLSFETSGSAYATSVWVTTFVLCHTWAGHSGTFTWAAVQLPTVSDREMDSGQPAGRAATLYK